MPLLVQGFGTSFIGKRDFKPDGSYITTEWIVIFFFPVFPLRSFRVIKTEALDAGIAYQKHRYDVLQKLPVSLRQAACVYAFALTYILYFFWMIYFLTMVAAPRMVRAPNSAADGVALGTVIAGLVWLPSLMPWALRKRAKCRNMRTLGQR